VGGFLWGAGAVREAMMWRPRGAGP
jgi:hypothetical protein